MGFANRLRDAGMKVKTVSVSSTPTMYVEDSLKGVTEIRPGNYAFFDVFQWMLGICKREDIAMTVLGSVVGTYPDRNTFLIDAGALSLPKDRGANHIDTDSGYGLTMDGEEQATGSLLRVSRVTQEHRVVCGPRQHPTIDVGARVKFYPNRSCLTEAMHERFLVVQEDEIVGQWTPIQDGNKRN